MSTPETDTRLETWENDNKSGQSRTFFRYEGDGHSYAGDFPDLDDREVEWNDIIRSCVLYGPPGTTVWLYDKKNYEKGDDILEIKILENGMPVTLNKLDVEHPPGVRWEKKNNGIAGKVSSIKWK